ncbi:hypothetical protein CR513_09846, partial [Mucuna pruriens]
MLGHHWCTTAVLPRQSSWKADSLENAEFPPFETQAKKLTHAQHAILFQYLNQNRNGLNLDSYDSTDNIPQTRSNAETIKCRMPTRSRQRLIQFDLNRDESDTVSAKRIVGCNRVGLTQFRMRRSWIRLGLRLENSKIKGGLVVDKSTNTGCEFNESVFHNDRHERTTKHHLQVKTSRVNGVTIKVNFLFPQRLKDDKKDKVFVRFLEIFRKLHINIPFIEVIAQISNYAKFFKETMSNKKKLEGFEVIMFQQRIHEVSLFPTLWTTYILKKHYVNWKLGLLEPQPTSISLQLADKTFTHPFGIVESVLVKVEEFIFPSNFVILDMEKDDEFPIISRRVMIDVKQGNLTLRLDNNEFLTLIKVHCLLLLITMYRLLKFPILGNHFNTRKSFLENLRKPKPCKKPIKKLPEKHKQHEFKVLDKLHFIWYGPYIVTKVLPYGVVEKVSPVKFGVQKESKERITRNEKKRKGRDKRRILVIKEWAHEGDSNKGKRFNHHLSQLINLSVTLTRMSIDKLPRPKYDKNGLERHLSRDFTLLGCDIGAESLF